MTDSVEERIGEDVEVGLGDRLDVGDRSRMIARSHCFPVHHLLPRRRCCSIYTVCMQSVDDQTRSCISVIPAIGLDSVPPAMGHMIVLDPSVLGATAELVLTPALVLSVQFHSCFYQR